MRALDVQYAHGFVHCNAILNVEYTPGICQLQCYFNVDYTPGICRLQRYFKCGLHARDLSIAMLL